MDQRAFANPDLKRVQRAFKYLRENGGLEITPCVWIHPVHVEVIVVTPDGRLQVHRDRTLAAMDFIAAWRGVNRPTVTWSNSRWPALSEQPPARSPAPAVSLPIRPPQ